MFKHKLLNEWSLFWLISGSISVAMLIAMSGADLSTGEGISSMIQLSVRCAVPLLFVAFGASSLQIVYPSTFSRWLLKNRKFIGLSFAAAMAWQLLFILWLVIGHSDYYVNEVYVLRDAIEGVVGYLFLFAMTVTSFKFARKRIKPKNWKLLHKSGIYFIWAYAFSVYWWALSYYPDPQWIDYLFYWAGFAAWGLRAAAWHKKHKPMEIQPLQKISGGLIILAGLVAAAIGRVWQPAAEQLLMGYSFTKIPETYMPYWPFEPFLPLFVIALGIFVLTRENTSSEALIAENRTA